MATVFDKVMDVSCLMYTAKNSNMPLCSTIQGYFSSEEIIDYTSEFSPHSNRNLNNINYINLMIRCFLNLTERMNRLESKVDPQKEGEQEEEVGCNVVSNSSSGSSIGRGSNGGNTSSDGRSSGDSSICGSDNNSSDNSITSNDNISHSDTMIMDQNFCDNTVRDASIDGSINVDCWKSEHDGKPSGDSRNKEVRGSTKITDHREMVIEGGDDNSVDKTPTILMEPIGHQTFESIQVGEETKDMEGKKTIDSHEALSSSTCVIGENLIELMKMSHPQMSGDHISSLSSLNPVEGGLAECELSSVTVSSSTSLTPTCSSKFISSFMLDDDDEDDSDDDDEADNSDEDEDEDSNDSDGEDDDKVATTNQKISNSSQKGFFVFKKMMEEDDDTDDDEEEDDDVAVTLPGKENKNDEEDDFIVFKDEDDDDFVVFKDDDDDDFVVFKDDDEEEIEDDDMDTGKLFICDLPNRNDDDTLIVYLKKVFDNDDQNNSTIKPETNDDAEDEDKVTPNDAAFLGNDNNNEYDKVVVAVTNDKCVVVKRKKRVRFNSKIEFHQLGTPNNHSNDGDDTNNNNEGDDEDERECRRGPWEMYARDRMRFRKRIEDSETTLGWLFYPNHRRKMMEIIDDSIDVMLNKRKYTTLF